MFYETQRKNNLIQKLNAYKADLEQDFTREEGEEEKGEEDTSEAAARNPLKFEDFDLDKINDIQMAIKNYMDYEKLVKQSKEVTDEQLQKALQRDSVKE